MKKLFLTTVTALFASVAIAQDAQKPIYYSVSFPNAQHHDAEILKTVPDAPDAFRFRMSRSSAGRYATHEFGKNVYNVKATDGKGKELPLRQVEGDVYEVGSHPETVKITYTLFANHTDGTYASIDPSHAHLNMPAAFMWIP